MDRAKNKVARRNRRHIGIRKRIAGVPGKPRLSVYKSLNHIYAQVIDDLAGSTLVAASTADKDLKLESNTKREPEGAAAGVPGGDPTGQHPAAQWPTRRTSACRGSCLQVPTCGA